MSLFVYKSVINRRCGDIGKYKLIAAANATSLLYSLLFLFEKTKCTGYHIYNNNQCIPAGLYFRGGCIFLTPTGSISYRETLLMVGRCLQFVNHSLGIVSHGDMTVALAVYDKVVLTETIVAFSFPGVKGSCR